MREGRKIQSRPYDYDITTIICFGSYYRWRASGWHRARCRPNHIVGKGMIRRIKDDYPWSNVVAIDYDPGATKINQENRIKLMLANARAIAREQAQAEESTPAQTEV